MSVISVANLKGGAGKTPTALCLAMTFAKLGKKVCIIDMDPQANASSFCDIPEKKMIKDNIVTLLQKGSGALSKTVFKVSENIDLIPGILDLEEFDTIFATRYGKDLLLNDLVYPTLVNKYDHIVIDCPPSIGVTTRNALVCSDTVVIPINAYIFAIEGAAKMIGNIEEIRESGLRKEFKVKNVYILPIMKSGFFASFDKAMSKFAKDKLSDKEFLPNVTPNDNIKKAITAGETPPRSIMAEFEKVAARLLNGN